MKLLNHIPHKLKKRTLKLGEGRGNVNQFWRNSRYYNTLKILKATDLEAYRYLKDRLRVKGIIGKSTYNQSFTGSLMSDFVWRETPQGAAFWALMDDYVKKQRFDNAKRKGAKK